MQEMEDEDYTRHPVPGGPMASDPHEAPISAWGRTPATIA